MILLSGPHLRLAISTAIVAGMSLADVQDKLFRHDADVVRYIYDDIKDCRSSLEPVQHRSNNTKRVPMPTRNRSGLTITAIADHFGVARVTLVALLEHHGFIELVPFGGTQSRYLVTDTAFAAEVGHNVVPSNRIGHLEGHGKAAAFPVFYEERLGDLFWCLDYEGIRNTTASLDGKKSKLAWLLDHHSYLPDQEIADLAGYARSGVIKARATRCVDRSAA